MNEKKRQFPLKNTFGMQHTYTTSYGLAFDIVRSRSTKSGYKPAQRHYETGLAMYGDLRLHGMAAALRMGFVDQLLMVGRDEPRYPGKTVLIDGERYPINQAWAIRRMLIVDCGIEESRVGCVNSGTPQMGGTSTKAELIASMMDSHMGDAGSDNVLAVITNHYHVDRTYNDFLFIDRSPAIFPAEAFWLAECDDAKERQRRRQHMISRFGGGPYAKRAVAEITGIADHLFGDYIRTSAK